MGRSLFGRVRDIIEGARRSAVRSVNTAQVVSNWLIGREIVEEQQRGKLRAEYGKALLGALASRLSAAYGRGYGVDNLELFRRFYAGFSALISDAVRRNFPTPGRSMSSKPSRTAGRGGSWRGRSTACSTSVWP